MDWTKISYPKNKSTKNYSKIQNLEQKKLFLSNCKKSKILNKNNKLPNKSSTKRYNSYKSNYKIQSKILILKPNKYKYFMRKNL